MDDIEIYSNLFEHYDHHFVMIAHCLYKSLSSKISTFSEEIITKLLKEKLKFRGVTVSDDLLMSALDKEQDMSKRASLSFSAGMDLLLVSRIDDRFFQMYDGLQKKITDFVIKSSRLSDARKRIEKLKSIKIFTPSFNPQRGIISDMHILDISRSLLSEKIHFKPEDKNYIIHMPESASAWSPVSDKGFISNEISKNINNLEVRYYDIKAGLNKNSISKNAVNIILTLNPYYNENYLKSLQEIDDNFNDFIILSMGEPQEKEFIRNSSAIINLYSTNPIIIKNTFKTIFNRLDCNNKG